MNNFASNQQRNELLRVIASWPRDMTDTYITGQDLVLISVRSRRRRAAHQDSPKGGPPAESRLRRLQKSSYTAGKTSFSGISHFAEGRQRLDEGRVAVAEKSRGGSGEWSKRVDDTMWTAKNSRDRSGLAYVLPSARFVTLRFGVLRSRDYHRQAAFARIRWNHPLGSFVEKSSSWRSESPAFPIPLSHGR
jgi:hypothetical protein